MQVPMTMPEGLPPVSSSDGVAGFVGDPVGILAGALVNSQIQWSEGAVRERAFLRLYLGAEMASELLGPIEGDKLHQSFGTTKMLMQAIESMSLKQFMQAVNLNLGGK